MYKAVCDEIQLGNIILIWTYSEFTKLQAAFYRDVTSFPILISLSYIFIYSGSDPVYTRVYMFVALSKFQVKGYILYTQDLSNLVTLITQHVKHIS